jgi:hypothetical protein
MDPLQIQLLREATRSVCAVCSKNLGIQPIPEGGKGPVQAIGPAGFAICVECRGQPVRLPDGTVIPATSV